MIGSDDIITGVEEKGKTRRWALENESNLSVVIVMVALEGVDARICSEPFP